jgi:hypothetical protein
VTKPGSPLVAAPAVFKVGFIFDLRLALLAVEGLIDKIVADIVWLKTESRR